MEEESEVEDETIPYTEEAAVAAASTTTVTTAAVDAVGTKVKRKKPMGRRKFRMEKCTKDRWTCEEEKALWRIYMKTYIENERRLEREDKFKRRKPGKQLSKLPRMKSAEEIGVGVGGVGGGGRPYKCYLPLNAFQFETETALPDKLDRTKMIRIWRNMRRSRTMTAVRRENTFESSMIDWDETMWPCDRFDLSKEIYEREKSEERKRKDTFPCGDESTIKDEVLSSRRLYEDIMMADRKELGHARLPEICPKMTKSFMVDRDAGERPGLVDGDYVVFEFYSRKKGPRVYADVCLRGLKGMHLIELSYLRDRRRTWKFCFYQAIVALLAKTQLRYKYAWSVNIDYIYDHAWMLFTHIGTINIKDRQRLDDIVVYNYKYSVEIVLIQEMRDVKRITGIDREYEEQNLRRRTTLNRRELMDVKLELGSEKLIDGYKLPVHKGTKIIEDWFDGLSVEHRNCIFRTTKYSLAFWQDGSFWYLYNPYRCDEYGYWDDDGYACIMKFCTRRSLRRHLMILLLRAYVYDVPKSRIPVAAYVDPARSTSEKKEEEEIEEEEEEGEEKVQEEGTVEVVELKEPEEVVEEKEDRPAETVEEGGEAKKDEPMEMVDDKVQEVEEGEKEDGGEIEGRSGEAKVGDEGDEIDQVFTIQIFDVIYHCCQINNLKLLERKPKEATRRVKRKTIDDCPFDPLDRRDLCTIERDAEGEGEGPEGKDEIEKPEWLKLFKTTWSRCGLPSQSPSAKKKMSKDIALRMHWHQYRVEESNKLFSLWGELHVTDGIFDKENRGLQVYACYVVCAGMTRIIAPEYWSSKTLDVIVMCGDRYYTQSKLEADFKSNESDYEHVTRWNGYLTRHFKIGETMFEANVLPGICGRLYARKTNAGKYLWRSLEQMFFKYQFGILTCESHCLCVFKFCGAYYMCDVNSYGPPLFQIGQGTVYTLRATYFYKFMVVLILTIGSPECSRFTLNPIEIIKVIDVDTTGPADLPIGKAKRCDRRGKRDRIVCPYDEDKKRQMKRWKVRRSVERRTIDKTCCKIEDD